MEALFSSWVFWAFLALFFIGGAFALGSRTAERAAGDERDELVKYYDAKLATAGREGQISLDRFKGLLDDVKAKAKENEDLVKDLENHWQPQPAEHHRGKAAAYRDILARYRGW